MSRHSSFASNSQLFFSFFSFLNHLRELNSCDGRVLDQYNKSVVTFFFFKYKSPAEKYRQTADSQIKERLYLLLFFLTVRRLWNLIAESLKRLSRLRGVYVSVAWLLSNEMLGHHFGTNSCVSLKRVHASLRGVERWLFAIKTDGPCLSWRSDNSSIKNPKFFSNIFFLSPSVGIWQGAWIVLKSEKEKRKEMPPKMGKCWI